LLRTDFLFRISDLNDEFVSCIAIFSGIRN
jgi:hypothetical protein